MTNAFEYGDALLPQSEPDVHSRDGANEEEEEQPPLTPSTIENNQPYLNLAT